MTRLPLVASSFNFAAAHAQARLDSAAAIAPDDVAQAYQSNLKGHRVGLYRETATRAQWRSLFDAAVALPDVLVAVTYIKNDGEPRTMLCQPYERNSDATYRYVTVWDVEAGAYRRVNLDAIVKLTLETSSLEAQWGHEQRDKLNQAALRNSN